MDLRTLTDDELTAHRDAVAAEIERRTRLETAPATVAQIAARYIEDGGNVEALRDAIA